LLISEALSNATRITGAVELKKPKTRIKINGKRKLKITADGLRNIESKLALAMANMA
jgi:hypothetical protein